MDEVRINEIPGRYSEISTQGKGAMGRVLLVHDRALRRDVVLKELLPPKAGDDMDPEALERQSRIMRARFLHEARITGRLEHPGIAPVYEAGHRADGTPYYTMKKIRGRTLSEALESASSLDERLRLLSHFVDLCQALAYAHDQGVIHRDVKPSNVIVGDFGETVILDWGLAKMIDEDFEDPELDDLGPVAGRLGMGPAADGTATGEVLGSPLYMAPEQARGDAASVDFRTDVYALGVILYQILSGKTPFPWTTLEEVIDKVAFEEPPAIDRLSEDAPPELVAICTRAMKKSPEERYQSAMELAEEVRRFQSGALVKAYHYQAADLVSRFVSRHRVALSSAAVVLIGVLVLSLAFTVNAVQSARRLAEARDAAVAARRDAEAQRDLVLEAMDKLTYAIPNRLMGVPEARPIVQEMLDDNVALLDRIIELSPDTKEARIKKVFNYQGIGLRWAVLGDTVSAINAHLRAVKEAEAIVSEYPMDPEAQMSVASSYQGLAYARRVHGDHANALKDYQRGMRSLNSVSLADQDEPTLVLATVRCWSGIGACHFGLGDPLMALDAYAHAESILKSLIASDHAKVEYQIEVINLARDRGNAHWRRGEYTAALDAFETSINKIEAVLATTPRDKDLTRVRAYCLNKIGVTRQALEQFDEAREAHSESRNILESLLADDPLNVGLQRAMSSNICDIGASYSSEGDYEAAYPYYDRSRRILETLLSRDATNVGLRKDLAWLWNNLADVDRARGNYDSALEKYERSRDVHEALQEKAPDNARLRLSLAHVYDNIGLLHLEYEKFEAAALALEQGRDAWNILRTEDPESTALKDQLADTLSDLGLVYDNLDNQRAAVECWSGSVELFENVIVEGERRGYSVTKYGDTIAMLRTLYGEAAQADERTRIQQRYVHVLQKVAEGDPEHIPYQETLARESAKLASDFARQNRSLEARRYYDDGLRILQHLNSKAPHTNDYASEIERIQQDRKLISSNL